jgi:hypothetical protein
LGIPDLLKKTLDSLFRGEQNHPRNWRGRIMCNEKTSDEASEAAKADPTFAAQVAILSLVIYVAFGCAPYGPYAVIVFFGVWRLAVSRSYSIVDRPSSRDVEDEDLSKPSDSTWWAAINWRLLASIVLLVVSFWAVH